MNDRSLALVLAFFLTACAGDEEASPPVVGGGTGADTPGAELPADPEERYLATNAARDGVTVTESGLQYEVLRSTTGPKPDATSNVTIHYVGTLIDGSEFDSSVARGEPATFPVNGVIAGLAEGLQLMSVGSRYRFVLPADLAYGDAGAGRDIPPGATLTFEVDLLEINSG